MTRRQKPQETLQASGAWRPRFPRGTRPSYVAIVDALAADIEAGRVAPGARLPPQRDLAAHLDVNLTTVTRAFREATRRGLINATVGRGTFVSSRASEVYDWRGGAHAEPESGIDLARNTPPEVAFADLAAALAEQLRGMAAAPEQLISALSYHSPAGRLADRAAAASWLSRTGAQFDAERMIVCCGAQHVLSIVLPALVSPNAIVLCEDLTYQGLMPVAKAARIRLVGVATDADGLIPDAFAAAVKRHKPAALFTTPTLQNPTASVLPAKRRAAIADVAARANMLIVEDDVYGMLADAPPPLAAIASESTIFVSGLSKSVAPGLRIGFVHVPTPAMFAQIEAAMRGSVWMAPPLLAQIAAEWLRNGTAEHALAAVRAELRARGVIAQRILGAKVAGPKVGSPHVWIPLRDDQPSGEVAGRLAERRVYVSSSEAFRVDAAGANGLRVCLGAAPTREMLDKALRIIAATVSGKEPRTMQM